MYFYNILGMKIVYQYNTSTASIIFFFTIIKRITISIGTISIVSISCTQPDYICHHGLKIN